MARKSRKAEQLKHEIISSVPVDQRKMITQPITFTYLKGEMSMMQTRIQTMIMEKLQDKIKRALDRRFEDGFVGDLFRSEDYKPISADDRSKYLSFRIAYSELGVEPAHYNDVDIAAKAMQSIVYEKEVGEKMRYIVAFPVVDIDKDIPGRRRQNIYLHMTESTAKDLFDMTKQYHKYLKDAIFLFSSNYAGRIYLLINAYKGLGTWKVLYEKLRKILLTSYDEKTQTATVDKYRDINDFKKRVLEPARREILEAADRIDCTFDYEFQYPAGKRRGTPEYVIFHIRLTDLGRNINRAQLESQETSELRKRLIRLRLTTTEANRIIGAFIRRMGSDKLVLLADKASELERTYADAKAGRRKGEPIGDTHLYSLTAFRNFIEESKAAGDAVDAEAVEVADAGAEEGGGGKDTSRFSDAFRLLLDELRGAWSRHTESEGDRRAFDELLSALRLKDVDEARRLVLLGSDGPAFNREFAVPYYWEPADFDSLVARHFGGYGWADA